MDSDTGAYPYPPDGGGHHGVLMFVVVVLLAAILAAGAALGMYLARQGEAARRKAIRQSIFDAVRKPLERAVHAKGTGGPEVIIAARELVEVMTIYLGPLFVAGRPISGSIDQINRALKGKIMDAAKSAPPPPPPQPTLAASTTSKEQGTTTVITPSVVTNINVTPNGQDQHGKPEAPPKPVERDMTVPEQINEVGKAVESLNQFWKFATVDAFLDAAQKALLDVRPVETKDDHGGGHGH
jgi:hypothetical protein